MGQSAAEASAGDDQDAADSPSGSASQSASAQPSASSSSSASQSTSSESAADPSASPSTEPSEPSADDSAAASDSAEQTAAGEETAQEAPAAEDSAEADGSSAQQGSAQTEGQQGAEQATGQQDTGQGAQAEQGSAAAQPAAAGVCDASSLAGSLQPVDAGMGSVHYQLVLTNTGSQPCVLSGYPGVSYADAAGQPVGIPASRAPEAGAAVTVAPGQSASAGLQETGAGSYGQVCNPHETSALVVYPPGSTEALSIAHSTQACGNPKIGQLQVKGFGA